MDAFVYGTLMIPEVRARLGGGHLVARPAQLAGFTRRLVRGETYPSLAPDPAGHVEGLLLLGLDADLVARWDAYEGEPYERLRVRPTSDGEPREAWVWLLRAEERHRLGEEEWSLDRFLERDLASFLRDYPGWEA